jgi:nicotinamidase-related amidase
LCRHAAPVFVRRALALALDGARASKCRQAGRAGAEPELAHHLPPAAVFDKWFYSAFASPELHKFLRRSSIDTLIISGSETDVCVLSTMLAAIDHGYRIIMARDAVCSSSDASHNAVINLFHRRFDVQVEVADVAEILDAWRPG